MYVNKLEGILTGSVSKQTVEFNSWIYIYLLLNHFRCLETKT